MHFTVVFDGPEHRDLSYGLVLVPCPVWVDGDREILNLHPDDPNLRPGDVKRLLEEESISALLGKGPRKCTVVAHSEGNGSVDDLATLLRDLTEEGFKVSLAGNL
jgi:hypothetical protein